MDTGTGPLAPFTWALTVNGVTQSNTTPCKGCSGVMTFQEPNGVYLFSVSSVPVGFESYPSSGTVTVNGLAVTQSLTVLPLTSGSLVNDYNLNYGATTTLTQLPQGGQGPDQYNWLGLYYNANATVILPGPQCSNANGSGGNWTFSSTYVMTCNETPTFAMESWMQGSLAGSGYLLGPTLSDLIAGVNTTWGQVGGVAGAVRSWLDVSFSRSQPDVHMLDNVTSYTGPNSTGNACPCTLELSGVEYPNLVAFNHSYSLTTPAASISLLPGYYSGQFWAQAGWPYPSAYGAVDTGFELVVGENELPSYNVTFNETGLAAGTPWSVSLDGTSQTSTTHSITFSEPNGTHAYTLGAFPSLGQPADSGVVTVSGSDIRVNVTTTLFGPEFNAYSFGNPGSIWNTNGNCYGMSSTEALYFEHYVLHNPIAPYYPNVSEPLNPLPDLAVAPAPSLNSGQLWDVLNNLTLAITMHQLSSENTLAGLGDNVIAESIVMSELGSGQPAVIGVGLRHPHAVLVYRAISYPNGSVRFDVSDPNFGLGSTQGTSTTYAWYNQTTGSFWFVSTANDNGVPYVYRDFEAMDVTPLERVTPTWLQYTNNWALLTRELQGGWQLVESEGVVHVYSNSAVDYFADAGLGNSESFHEGIAGSSGIEEGGIQTPTGIVFQAYAVPPIQSTPPFILWPPVRVTDPSPHPSSVRIVQGGNLSGVPFMSGLQLNVTSPSTSNYTLQTTPNGFEIQIGSSPVVLNLSVFNASVTWSGTSSWAMLEANGLSFAADTQVSVTVTNWTALNSTTQSSVDLTVTAANGTQATYHLHNGETGLGTSPSPPPPPGPTPPWWQSVVSWVSGPGRFLTAVGVLVLILAVVARVVRSRSAKRRNPPGQSK